MSGRFVRASKYRHVNGVPAKKDKVFAGVRAETQSDGNCIAASTAFWAVALQGGGGPVLAYPHNKPGRIEANGPKINVHKSKVTDLEFSPFLEGLLATGGEDAAVKIVNIPAGGLKADVTEASQSLMGHQKKLAMVRWHPTAAGVLATSAYDHAVKVWDVEKGTATIEFEEKGSDVHLSLEWSEDGSQLATAAKDKQLRLFDPRAKGAVGKTAGLDGVKGQRVAWIHGQGRIITVGHTKNNARAWQLFDCKKLDAPISSGEFDNNPGALIPHFDADTGVLYLTGKGDAAVRYWEVTKEEEPHVHFLNEYRDTESTKGACFLPKASVDTKICEVAILYRVMKDSISPVSLQVPRKSELFQADLYPDTNAWKPVTTADEYFAGTNRNPLKRSMKPGSAAPDSKVAAGTNFSKQDEKKAAPAASVGSSSSGGAPKSAAELQVLLDAANAKIKELEEELAKYKHK